MSDTSSPAPPPATSTPAAPATPRMPSAAGYWVGGIVITVGLIAAAVWMGFAVVNLVTFADDFERIEVPGSATLTISATGTYTLWAETATSVDAFDTVREPEVRITGPDGEEVDTDPRFSTESYDTTNHHGVSFADFEVDQVGDYTFDVFEGEGAGRDVIAVAVGQSEVGASGLEILGAIGVGSVALLVGLVVIIVTAVRRSRVRKALTPPRPAYGYAPYAPVGPSPYPPSVWGPPAGPGVGPPPSVWGPPAGPGAGPPPSVWGPPAGPGAGAPRTPWAPAPGTPPPSVGESTAPPPADAGTGALAWPAVGPEPGPTPWAAPGTDAAPQRPPGSAPGEPLPGEARDSTPPPGDSAVPGEDSSAGANPSAGDSGGSPSSD